ncbi:hypothetical protein [Fangia hongkongensis]|nr:hypothetical protein [Fangia hongkongensis]
MKKVILSTIAASLALNQKASAQFSFAEKQREQNTSSSSFW